MLPSLPKNVSQLCIHTGNILNLSEVKKKAGQDATEEILSSLKIAVKGWVVPDTISESCLEIKTSDENINTEGRGAEPTELKTSVKIFITQSKKETLQEAIDNLFASLETNSLDSVVLAYADQNASNNDLFKDIQELWKVLEYNVEKGKLDRIGISDVDTDLFIQLYKSAKVKPSIVQINLQSCCVVPPALQDFTKENEVQLLTHNDPLDILPSQALAEIFENNEEKLPHLNWASRYQVHVICRGVLAIKGYIVSINLN